MRRYRIVQILDLLGPSFTICFPHVDGLQLRESVGYVVVLPPLLCECRLLVYRTEHLAEEQTKLCQCLVRKRI
jgi:hypothetical protein